MLPKNSGKHPQKLTFSHLKMDGWNNGFLLGPGLFSGAKLFVSGRVPPKWMVKMISKPMTKPYF